MAALETEVRIPALKALMLEHLEQHGELNHVNMLQITQALADGHGTELRAVIHDWRAQRAKLTAA